MSLKVDTYIVIAQQQWALDLGSNARNMAIELNNTHRVLYVNPSLDVNTLFKNLIKLKGWERLWVSLGLSANTKEIGPNIWVHTPAAVSLSINWLKWPGLFNRLNRLNAFLFFCSLNKALTSLNIKDRSYIVLNDSQMFTGRYVKKYLQPLQNFYYIRDNLVHHPYFKKHGVRIEPETIQQADVIFANSAYLADYARQFNKHSYDIGQGCELEMYDACKQYEEPADLAGIPHPRIGYAGFLTGERLDIKLLEQLADLKPGWQWVFIGPEEIMFQQSRLHQIENVHFLGAKKGSQIPAYMQHVDVCINPQLVNELTVGNYPRKIDEYLAMGKPTVATHTPAMQMFLPHVLLAVGTDEYLKAIENALMSKPASVINAAIEFSKSHTWQSCIKKIKEKEKIIEC